MFRRLTVLWRCCGVPEYIEKLAAIHAIKNYGIDAINEKRRSLDIADGFCNQGVKKKGDEHNNID